jgi:uncharacterized protein
MTNALIDSASPYLLQHARNPVQWMPWGEPALSKARAEDKPIFLSIGYAACHWCHVMAHESFEDPALAALLNEHFVPVKVDREERPDLDSVYMDAVVALTGHGGWPLSVFLTPAGVPFHGGTYFPPRPSHGLPSFRQVLEAVADAWRGRRAEVLRAGDSLRAELARAIVDGLPPAAALDPGLSQAALENLVEGFDVEWGGWGGAPKFPQPLAIEFLLRRHRRNSDGLALDLARRTLRAMARGGMFDHVGGGFHRYATDRAWHVPHFEKMLYDQALLARAYVRGWQQTGEAEFRQTAEATLDFVVRELALPDGGFASSLDADTSQGEGRFYLWTKEDLLRGLGDDGAWAAALYGLEEPPNFEGGSIVRLSHSPQEATGALSLSSEQVARLQDVNRRLLVLRAQRQRPALDDKVIAAWNGLMLSALSLGARLLDRPDLAEAAERCARFLLRNLVHAGRARRAWRAGRLVDAGFAEDHAALALGFLEHYQTAFDETYYATAVALCESLLAHFQTPEGGFHDTSTDHEQLVTRPFTVHDAPTPSASALACSVMLRLHALDGDARWMDAVERVLPRMLPIAARQPASFAQWLLATEDVLGGIKGLAIVGAVEDARLNELRAEAARTSWPETVATFGRQHGTSAIPLLAGRLELEAPARAYVCSGMTCRLPSETVDDLRRQLAP